MQPQPQHGSWAHSLSWRVLSYFMTKNLLYFLVFEKHYDPGDGRGGVMGKVPLLGVPHRLPWSLLSMVHFKF